MQCTHTPTHLDSLLYSIPTINSIFFSPALSISPSTLLLLLLLDNNDDDNNINTIRQYLTFFHSMALFSHPPPPTTTKSCVSLISNKNSIHIFSKNGRATMTRSNHHGLISSFPSSLSTTAAAAASNKFLGSETSKFTCRSAARVEEGMLSSRRRWVGRDEEEDEEAEEVVPLPSLPVPPPRPRVLPERVNVLFLVALVMCLCNADRVVMSVAVVPLAARYGWSTSFMGVIQSSFLLGYLVSSVAGGALVDKHGGKLVMAVGVMLWSLATIITPWASDHSTTMLLVVRILFGLAEGVAVPSMNIILSQWFPSHERASAVGLSMAGFHIGNVIGFLASPVLVAKFGITGPFTLFAMLGFMWMSIWVLTTAANPLPRRSGRQIVGSPDLLRIRKAGRNNCDIRHLLSKMPTWAIIFANFTNNWGYFVLLSWMPVYFRTVFHVNLKQAAWFSAIPWGMMAVSGYIAGLTSDYLIGSGYAVTRVRKIMQSIGFIGPGIALLFLNSAGTPSLASFFLTIALSLSSFSQAGFLLNVQDIAPRCAGFLHGISNSTGTVAAIVGTMGTGYFVQWLGSFQAFLTLTAALYFITAIFWNIYATGEQVFY